MARRSRVIGDFALRRLLRRMPEAVEAHLKPAIKQGAEMILADMQHLVPRDTGTAASQLTAFVAKSGLDAQIGLRGKRAAQKAYYLYFIEFGTKGYSGQKRSANRNRRASNKTDGEHWFGRYPEIPARPAHPFIRPAFDMNKEAVVALVRNAVASTLAQAARGSP